MEYVAQDLIHLPKLYNKQLEFIKKYELETLLEIEQSFLPILANIELEGQLLDVEKWRNLAKKNTLILNKVEKGLDNRIRTLLSNDLSKVNTKLFRTREELIHVPINLFETTLKQKKIKGVINEPNYGSHVQVKAICRALGAEISSTKEDIVKAFIRDNPGHKVNSVLKRLGFYREYKKAVSTYGEKFLSYLNSATGKIHTQYTQCWTDTGRLSSGDEKTDEGKKARSYVNFQQIPKDNRYRNCFVAPEGFSTVTIDFSNCELRILASESQEPVLLDNFNIGMDLHSYMGQIAYRVVKDDPTLIVSNKINTHLRTKAKGITFGLSYGAGPKKIAETVNTSVDKAKIIYNNYRQMLPKMFNFLEGKYEFAKENGYIIANNRTKRRKWFIEYLELGEEGSMRTESYNYGMQATNADMTKESCVEIDKWLRTNNLQEECRIVNLIHDEIVLIIKKDKAEIYGKAIEQIMVDTANRYLAPNISMKADMQIKPYWNK